MIYFLTIASILLNVALIILVAGSFRQYRIMKKAYELFAASGKRKVVV